MLEIQVFDGDGVDHDTPARMLAESQRLQYAYDAIDDFLTAHRDHTSAVHHELWQDFRNLSSEYRLWDVYKDLSNLIGKRAKEKAITREAAKELQTELIAWRECMKAKHGW